MPNIKNSYKKNNRKGQAAVEFLLTYGWAILGAMIAIGALSYFGIFNTQKFVRDTCYFGDQMVCEDYAVYQNGIVAVKLRNQFGVNIDINSSVVKSDYGTSTNATYSKSSAIVPGEVFEIRNNITNYKLPINSKLKYKMIVTFKATGSGNLHNQTGDVTATVQKP
jgi:hypothetical protein